MSRLYKATGVSMAGLLALAAIGTAAAQTPPPAPAATSVPASSVMLYATTTGNKLISFNSGTPGNIASTMNITGLQAGESVVGIDYRAATGDLVAVGSTSTLYKLDSMSGAATIIGSGPITTTLAGTSFGVDFNPTVDRLRVVSNQDQDLRLNPNNAAVGAVDGTLAYTMTDTNMGKDPNAVASAYTNNFPGATSTTLYNIDSNLDVLVRQLPPNAGVLNTVGALGVDAGEEAGFDIVGADTAFAALQVSGASNLYTINLMSGEATLIGAIGGGETVRGLTGMLSAVPATLTPVPATAVAAPGTPQMQATATMAMPAVSSPTMGSMPPMSTPMPMMTRTSMPGNTPGMPSTGGGDMTILTLAGIAAAAMLMLGVATRRKVGKI